MAESVDYASLDVGDEAPETALHVTVEAVRKFLKVYMGNEGQGSRFTDPDAAAAEGFDRKPVIPGPLGFVHLARTIVDWMPDARIEKLDVVYRSPTYLNTDYVRRAVITDRADREGEIRFEMDVYIETLDGNRTQRGAAVVYVPRG